MRISDWSSDVCSSDLSHIAAAEISSSCPSVCWVLHIHQYNLPRYEAVDRSLDRLTDELTRNRLKAGHDVFVSFPGFGQHRRSEEHTSELQSLMRISYAVFCLNKKTNDNNTLLQPK